MARPPDTIGGDAFAVAVPGFPAEMPAIIGARLPACTRALLGTAASDAARLTVTGEASSNAAASADQLREEVAAR